MENIYNDNNFGKNGLFIWIYPPGFIFLPYKFYQVFNNWTEHGMFFVFLFVLAALSCAVVLCTYQGLITVQRVSLQGDILKANTFFGQAIKFRKSDVTTVEKAYAPLLLRHIYLPLGRGGSNYRVSLQSGSVFYLSGATPNIEILLKNINE